MTTEAIAVERREGDLMVTLARGLVLVGMFGLPLLAFRVGKAGSVSDVIFALAAIFRLVANKRTDTPKTPAWFFGGFLMLVAGLTSSFFAYSRLGSVEVVANTFFVLFVWQWVTRSVLNKAEWVVKAIMAYALGCTFSSIVAIIQTEFHILGYRGLIQGAGSAAARAVGLTTQPDLTGVTDALAITFVLGIVLTVGLGRFWYRGICLAILGIALILTASVSGVLCSVLGIFIILLRRGVKLGNLLAVLAVLVGIYFAGSALQGHNTTENLNIFARISDTTTANSGYDTTSVRFATWHSAWRGIENSPVWGHGLDIVSSWVYYDPFLRPVTPYATHNVILLLWYEGGILMLLGVPICFASAIRRVVGRGNHSPIRDILLAGMIVVLVFSMQAPELVDRWFWLPFILAMTFRRGAADLDEWPPHRAALPMSAATEDASPGVGSH